MEPVKREILLSRSKSTGWLNELGGEYRGLSGPPCGHSCGCRRSSTASHDGWCDVSLSAEDSKLDSGFSKSFLDGEALLVLEQKVDRLSELLREQHTLLKSIKEDVVISKRETRSNVAVSEVSAEGTKEEPTLKNESANIEDVGEESIADPARSLLDAIQVRRDAPLDQIIRVALENFLQSDDVRARVAAATAESVRGALGASFCRVVADAYLPLVEHSHRRLRRHVCKLLHDSFVELEARCSMLFKSVQKWSRQLRASLERHSRLLAAAEPAPPARQLRDTLKGVLEEELKAWRELVAGEPPAPAPPDCDEGERPASPDSPMQPADPNKSAIDTLMKGALINKLVADGDINGAFEEALSSCDLALVVAACRAAPPAPAVSAALRPAVRLSLLQQLATDMVHDTQLKCRFLEEVIISLSSSEAWEGREGREGRVHLPVVVRDARRHLARFLRAYPKHRARRRVALILMAADTLVN